MGELDASHGDHPLLGETLKYIETRAARLDQLYDSVVSTRVLVERPTGTNRGTTFHVQIDVGVPDGMIDVSHQAEQDLTRAIRLSFDEAERQLASRRAA